MKKQLRRLACLAFALCALCVLPAFAFTFGGEAPAAAPAQEQEETPAEAEEAAPEPNVDERMEEAQEIWAATGWAPMLTGFSQEAEELVPKLMEILSGAAKWTAKKAPQNLEALPACPAKPEEALSWLTGRTASFTERDGLYVIGVETPPFLSVGNGALVYFKDMTVLTAERTEDNAFAAVKPQGAQHTARDFWMIHMTTGAYSWTAADESNWSFQAAVTVASDGLFGPAGSTDQVEWTAVRTGAEINQSIRWVLSPAGTLTVDIYYGDGNEVCRELVYSLSTGKLLSSDTW